MRKTRAELLFQLGAIEPTEETYAGLTKEDVPLLKELLSSSEHWLAARAVCALSRIRDVSASAVLADVSSDPRDEVRVALAASVANMQPAEAEQVLDRLLDDRALGVRKFAIHAVSPVHGRAIQAKLEALQAEDEDPAIRANASSKLRALGITR
jgi:HEAT repeat protein